MIHMRDFPSVRLLKLDNNKAVYYSYDGIGRVVDIKLYDSHEHGEYYYFSFAKGMAFYDKVTAINKYNFKEKEIGEMLTDEEEQKLWAIKNKNIWEKIYIY